MLADTSQIHDFGAAQHRHAADLTAVAADLAAARMPGDAFGSVGTRFLTALNAALAQQARHVTHLADRMTVAGVTAHEASDALVAADSAAGQVISR